MLSRLCGIRSCRFRDCGKAREAVHFDAATDEFRKTAIMQSCDEARAADVRPSRVERRFPQSLRATWLAPESRFTRGLAVVAGP